MVCSPWSCRRWEGRLWCRVLGGSGCWCCSRGREGLLAAIWADVAASPSVESGREGPFLVVCHNLKKSCHTVRLPHFSEREVRVAAPGARPGGGSRCRGARRSGGVGGSDGVESLSRVPRWGRRRSCIGGWRPVLGLAFGHRFWQLRRDLGRPWGRDYVRRRGTRCCQEGAVGTAAGASRARSLASGGADTALAALLDWLWRRGGLPPGLP